MTSDSTSLDRIFIGPGMIFCAQTPCVVSTVLGSCVAVCLWDTHVRVGGMNHYVLPHRLAEAPSPRFGDVAIEQLLDGMTRLGCRVGSLQAKIFGGAEVLPFGAHSETVGNQNVRIALELLQHHCIPVVARHTGGRSGLLIRQYSETGNVMVHRLADAHLAEPHQTVAADVCSMTDTTYRNN
jgi:chemotaxis protein CheD